jgi:Mg-chelatase subunit ChlD
MSTADPSDFERNDPPRPPSRRRQTFVLLILSALVHAGLLALAFTSDPPTDDEREARRAALLQSYLVALDERELEALEAAESGDRGDLVDLAAPLADRKEGGTGTRAKGEEGSMGASARGASGERFGVAGPADSPDPHIARQGALRDAQEFGMIGLMNSGAGGDPNAPVAPWGRDDSLGTDPLSARGNQWGAAIGDSFGAGGVGLSGIGEGGAGRGEGVGLGSIGTLGHGVGAGTGQGFGSGHGRLGGSRRTKPPSVSAGPIQVSGGGAAAPQAIQPSQAIQEIQEEPQEAPIDPNGRFATTYRPGAAHLAAFEALVARGLLQAPERALVSDVGGRFAPELALPVGKSMVLAAHVERAKAAPTGGPLHLRLALRGTDERAADRPHLSVHLVLDVSGSMEGESIAAARVAALELVRRLAPTDDFSLVTFASDARVLVPDGPVGARRASIEQTIRAIQTEGGTNIGEGLRLGYEQAKGPGVPEDAVRVVLLVSDGCPTAGITDRSSLARLALDAFQGDVQTSTFGVGTSYDGALMSAIADDGAGGYYYLRDAEQIAPALATELEHRLDPVATALELRVRLEDDVRLLKVYGSRRLGQEESARARAIEVAADQQAAKHAGIQRDRKDDREGGMRFLIPAFARGDRHALLLKLALPVGVDARRVAMIELRYKDRVFGRNVTEELPVAVEYAPSDADSARSADPSVARTVQAFLAGEAMMQAAGRVARGDRSSAAALLDEREQILLEAARALEEPRLAQEARRVARLRERVSPDGLAAEPLALAMLLETAGRARLH